MPRTPQRVDLPISPPTWLRQFRVCVLFGLGMLTLACGCQSTGSLAKLFPKTPKPTKSIQSLAGQKNKGGLPEATQAKNDATNLVKSLDAGQSALGKYYQETSPAAQQAHLTEAHQQYQSALKAEPGNSEAHHGLAIISDLRNDYNTAELHYQAALEKDPGNPAILGDMGYSYLLQGRLTDAETFLRQATQKDPGNTQAMKNLACVYGKQGQYNLAETTFRRVLNDGEVRQEMTKLFPNGRPDVADNERKYPWGQSPGGPTTEALKNRMEEARQNDVADMRNRQSTLDKYTEPTLTMDQLKAKVAQLEAERDAAHRSLDVQTAANTPLVIGDSTAHSATPGMQIQPQTRPAQPAGFTDRTFDTNSSLLSSSPPQSAPRKVVNSMFPNGVPQNSGAQPPSGIQQAGNQLPSWAVGQPNVQQALHQTKNQLDPRTGLPRQDNIQQTQGQAQGLLVPNSYGQNQTPQNSGLASTAPGYFPGSSSEMDSMGQFESAKRRAAMVGMGGPDMMFPIVEGTQRMTPGTGSTYNGSQYPAPPRYLPSEAAPHDLNQLMNAPSGQYTVQPNDKGQLNAPTGQTFQNPNFGQRLQPEIPVETPLGGPALYQEQAGYAQSPSGVQTSSSNLDPRGTVNSELYQFGTEHTYNPSHFNPSVNSQITTPSYGVPNQIQVPRGSEMMTPAWNQQAMTPSVMPPPYPGRPMETPSHSNASEFQSVPEAREAPSHTLQYHSEPAPIYSPGIQAPPSYRSRGNMTPANNGRIYPMYSESNMGPRINPSR